MNGSLDSVVRLETKREPRGMPRTSCRKNSGSAASSCTAPRTIKIGAKTRQIMMTGMPAMHTGPFAKKCERRYESDSRWMRKVGMT